MAKSDYSSNKNEKEKQRQKKREEKLRKKREREAEAANNSEGIDLVYVDEFGNLTDTPPDPSSREEVELEDIEIGVPKMDESQKEENSFEKQGHVSYFDHSKGFGFILENVTNEKYFVHVTGLIDEVEENDEVSFELEKGMKGMKAVRVKRIS